MCTYPRPRPQFEKRLSVAPRDSLGDNRFSNRVLILSYGGYIEALGMIGIEVPITIEVDDIKSRAIRAETKGDLTKRITWSDWDPL